MNGLGVLLEKRGEVGEAERFFREEMSIQKDLGDLKSVAWDAHEIAWLLKRRGETDGAEDFYREVISICKDLVKTDFSVRMSLAGAKNGLGDILEKRGEVDEAEALYSEALSIRRELAEADPSIGSRLAMTANSLALILERRGVKDEAVELFREALDIRRELVNKYEIASIAFRLGYMRPSRVGMTKPRRSTVRPLASTRSLWKEATWIPNPVSLALREIMESFSKLGAKPPWS